VVVVVVVVVIGAAAISPAALLWGSIRSSSSGNSARHSCSRVFFSSLFLFLAFVIVCLVISTCTPSVGGGGCLPSYCYCANMRQTDRQTAAAAASILHRLEVVVRGDKLSERVINNGNGSMDLGQLRHQIDGSFGPRLFFLLEGLVLS
jgi:hypothetical protein